jgi:predicted helicase
MEEVEKDFNANNRDEDPVIHFYEHFLKEYDAKKRMQRGVFYTPKPVVEFIVRSVHEILQKEFGLADGLADTTTWGEMKRRNSELQIPENVSPDAPFVQILDPATGTGTFLIEVIGLIHKTLESKWQAQGKSATQINELWSDYVPKHLLPRLFGFELMMAPYVIAHMKISLKLTETKCYMSRLNKRAQIYLTNTLEEPKDFPLIELITPALAYEATEANRVKRQTPITVVIGNPPYSGISNNMNRHYLK